MTQPTANIVNTVATAGSSTGVFITVFTQRNPTVNDIQFPIAKRWVNTISAKEFILTNFTTIGGQTQANWVNLTNGTAGGIDELSGNSGTNPVTPDVNGNVNVRGDSTSINIVGDGSHTLTANVVLPSTDYEVLVGRLTSIAGVTPAASGLVLTSNGTAALPTWQASASSLTIGPYGSAPNAAGGVISGGILRLEPADGTHPGGVTISAQEFAGTKTFDAAPIFPTLTGILTGNGVTAVSASAVAQYSTLVAGPTNSIVGAAPSSAGLVLTSNGASANPSFQAIPSSGLTWVAETANFSALPGHGYFCTGSIIAQLPLANVIGQTIAFFNSAGGLNLTIQTGTANFIQVGNTVCASNGTCAATGSGNSIFLVSDGQFTWKAIGAPQGNWILT